MRVVRRPLVILTGLLIAAAGLVLMPVPGPGGTPVFLAGLALLSTEVAWARKLMLRFKEAGQRMSPRKRVAITIGALIFYLASGLAVWAWSTL